MDISRAIASLMGPTMMAATSLETVNFDIWAGIHPTTVFLNGTLLFLGGLAVVRFHNLWVRDWRVTVTLLGWMVMLAGLYRMGIPDGPQGTRGPATFAVIALLFLASAFITWKAYRPGPQ
ncbi:MAG: hypothetical protein AAF724_07685 [Pseudomonadota bacterium]